MNTGLSALDIQLIVSAIAQHPEIQQAKIFGSRAKNTYKKGSDVDIALLMNSSVSAAKRKSILLALHEELEEKLPLPYFFDLIDFATINNPALIEHIERVGVALNLSNSELPTKY